MIETENPYAFVLGPLLLLVASFTWALGNVLLSILSQTIHVDVVVFIVYAASAVLIAPFYRPGNIKNIRNFSKQLFLMLVYFITSSIALAYSDPNDVTAIFMLTIFLTPLLSRVILGTGFNKCLLFFTLSWSFSGIILLVQPPFLFFRETLLTAQNLSGYALAFLAMLSRSLLTVYQREEAIDEMSITFWTPTGISIIFGSKLLLREYSWDLSLKSILMMCLIAALYQIGTFCNFSGWGITDPMISALVYQTQIIFTFIFYFLLGGVEGPVQVKLLGIILVLSAVCTYQYLDHQRKEVHNAYTIVQEEKRIGYKKLVDPCLSVPVNSMTASMTISSLR